MNGLARREVDRVDWSALPVMGDRSSEVPASLAGLIGATTREEAKSFYWRLENVVVVQGQLFEAAPAVVSVLMAALSEGVPKPAKLDVLELLFQLVSGESDREARARGNEALGDQCRERAREGLWTLYGEFGGEYEPEARDILGRIETNPDRLASWR